MPGSRGNQEQILRLVFDNTALGSNVAEIREDFTTRMSVSECTQAFREGVKRSYGGGRRLLRLASGVRGGGEGVEFFQPSGSTADLAMGAHVPGMNMLHGANRVTVHCYVEDRGDVRDVHLIGPYAMGDKGSTTRLLAVIRSAF